MTASLEGISAAVSPGGGGSAGLEASRNLFEHMANSASGMPQGASPVQIGDGLMERLNGFINRQRSFADHASVQIGAGASATWPGAGSAPPTASVAKATPAADPAASGQGPANVGPQQIDHIVSSLGRMFDYSIETQMVVRSATQVSGATNTLLKGQ
jgi:hypothetical protein